MARDEINAFLGAGTNFTGVLTFQGAVRIDGCYSGDIVSDGALIAGKDARIDGKVNVGEFSLAGHFSGDVCAKRRVIIHKGGILKGSVQCPALIVEDGALVDGTIVMGEISDSKTQED